MELLSHIAGITKLRQAAAEAARIRDLKYPDDLNTYFDARGLAEAKFMWEQLREHGYCIVKMTDEERRTWLDEGFVEVLSTGRSDWELDTTIRRT